MHPQDNHSFGVFKPVGHVVISFPSGAQAKQAIQTLRQLGLPDEALQYRSDREMLLDIERDMAQASPIAAIGQEINLIKAHRALAERGYHWLIVHAPNDALAARVAEAVKPLGAERAQYYGHFVIEELIEPDTGLTQVAESPDRGLDAQTLSGLETERADRAPRLPHEHDESADSAGSQTPESRELARQARADVSQGMVDTDIGPPLQIAGQKLKGTTGPAVAVDEARARQLLPQEQAKPSQR